MSSLLALARRLWPALWAAIAISIVTVCSFLLSDAPRAEDARTHLDHAGEAAMTPEAMQRRADDWFSQHPIVGRSSEVGVTVADTFFVSDFRFNSDGNALTQVDTAKIKVGEAVLWQWLQGCCHTVTNGTGSGDPQAGTQFNAPSDFANQTFQHTFTSAGTVPFFCSPHQLQNMRGVVVVSSTVDVPPGTGSRSLGFTAAPAPNPSRSGVSFQFGLDRAGRARAEVYDARGRRIAVVLDRMLEAGLYPASWDGRDARGVEVPPGVYHVRLRLPGLSESRSVVVAR